MKHIYDWTSERFLLRLKKRKRNVMSRLVGRKKTFLIWSYPKWQRNPWVWSTAWSFSRLLLFKVVTPVGRVASCWKLLNSIVSKDEKTTFKMVKESKEWSDRDRQTNRQTLLQQWEELLDRHLSGPSLLKSSLQWPMKMEPYDWTEETDYFFF